MRKRLPRIRWRKLQIDILPDMKYYLLIDNSCPDILVSIWIEWSLWITHDTFATSVKLLVFFYLPEFKKKRNLFWCFPKWYVHSHLNLSTDIYLNRQFTDEFWVKKRKKSFENDFISVFFFATEICGFILLKQRGKICMYIHVHLNIYAHTWTCMHFHTQTKKKFVNIHVHKCLIISVGLFFIFLLFFLCIFLHTHTHTHIYILLCVFVLIGQTFCFCIFCLWSIQVFIWVILTFRWNEFKKALDFS